MRNSSEVTAIEFIQVSDAAETEGKELMDYGFFYSSFIGVYMAF